VPIKKAATGMIKMANTLGRETGEILGGASTNAPGNESGGVWNRERIVGCGVRS
jgi:hypothetical protein